MPDDYDRVPVVIRVIEVDPPDSWRVVPVVYEGEVPE